MRTLLNVFLLVVAIVLLSLNWIVRSDPTRRNVEMLPSMVESIPYDSFAANPHFEDGKTLREKVPGTVIRGSMPLHYGTTPEEAERAGRELMPPEIGDEKQLARGAVVYANYCRICHGPEGKGDGPVAQRGFPMPASLIAQKALDMPDGRMFHVVTYGQGNMPSHAAQLGREDRWAAIRYVRELQRKAGEVPPPNASDAVVPSRQPDPVTLNENAPQQWFVFAMGAFA